jgi:hypothetical protein
LAGTSIPADERPRDENSREALSLAQMRGDIALGFLNRPYCGMSL